MATPVHLATLPARLVLRRPARALVAIQDGTHVAFLASLRLQMAVLYVVVAVLLAGSMLLALWKMELLNSPAMLLAPSLPGLILAPSAFHRRCFAWLGLHGTMHADPEMRKQVFSKAMEYDPKLLGPGEFPVYMDPWEAEVLYLLLYPEGRARLSSAGLSVAAPKCKASPSPPRQRF